MNNLNLLSAFLKVNIQMSLAYRADTVVNMPVARGRVNASG